MNRICVLVPLFLASGALLSGCSGYEALHFSLEYKCVSFVPVTPGDSDSAFICAEWEQNGGVSTPSCFPGDATVITRHGSKTMADLEIGEEILGFDHATRQSTFSPVRAWLHRHPDKDVLMKRVEGDRVSIVASEKHSLALQDTQDYEFAGSLTPEKNVLMTSDGLGAKVKKVSDEYAKGLFAPLTGTSNYYVGHGSNRSVLAHSFAQLKSPRRYESVFHRLIDVGEFFWSAINDVHDEAYIHPIAQVLMDVFGYSVVDVPIIKRRLQTAPGWSGFEETSMPFEASAEERRLYGGGGGGGNNDQQQEQLRIILYAAVSNLPPFLSNAATARGVAVAPQPFPRTIDVEEWLGAATKRNMIYAIVVTCLSVCLSCCWFCVVLGSGMAGDTSSRESGSESEVESMQSRG